MLLTGLHSVCDIFCESCRTTLGWKYVRSLPPPPPHCLRLRLTASSPSHSSLARHPPHMHSDSLS